MRLYVLNFRAFAIKSAKKCNEFKCRDCRFVWNKPSEDPWKYD